jgi:hypothetical protein
LRRFLQLASGYCPARSPPSSDCSTAASALLQPFCKRPTAATPGGRAQPEENWRTAADEAGRGAGRHSPRLPVGCKSLHSPACDEGRLPPAGPPDHRGGQREDASAGQGRPVRRGRRCRARLSPRRATGGAVSPTLLSASRNRLSSGCSGSGEGWAAGPSRRDAQRPFGDPLQLARSAGWGAAASSPRPPLRAMLPPSWSAESPQKVRKTLNRDHDAPAPFTTEAAGQSPVQATTISSQSSGMSTTTTAGDHVTRS